MGLPGMALSAWLSEELVRAAAFQGGVPGEGLPPPQSDNTAKDKGPGARGGLAPGQLGVGTGTTRVGLEQEG